MRTSVGADVLQMLPDSLSRGQARRSIADRGVSFEFCGEPLDVGVAHVSSFLGEVGRETVAVGAFVERYCVKVVGWVRRGTAGDLGKRPNCFSRRFDLGVVEGGIASSLGASGASLTSRVTVAVNLFNIELDGQTRMVPRVE